MLVVAAARPAPPGAVTLNVADAPGRLELRPDARYVVNLQRDSGATRGGVACFVEQPLPLTHWVGGCAGARQSAYVMRRPSPAGKRTEVDSSWSSVPPKRGPSAVSPCAHSDAAPAQPQSGPPALWDPDESFLTDPAPARGTLPATLRRSADADEARRRRRERS